MKQGIIYILLLGLGFSQTNEYFIEFSLGGLNPTNEPGYRDGTLANFEDGKSGNIKLKHYLNNNLYSNYFIEYNRLDHMAIPAEYEMYLIGVGLEKHFNIFKKSPLLGGTRIQIGSSLGISDDQYTLFIDDLELLSDYPSNFYTFDDNYIFVRFQVGIGWYDKLYKYSIFLKYEQTYTNEQYGISDFGDSITEDSQNIEYSSFKIGINYKLF